MNNLHVVGGQSQLLKPLDHIQMGNGTGIGSNHCALQGFSVSINIRIGRIRTLYLSNGGVRLTQRVEPTLGMPDISDTIGPIDRQRIDRGSAQRSHLPLVGCQRFVHGSAIGKIYGFNFKPIFNIQSLINHIFNGNTV